MKRIENLLKNWNKNSIKDIEENKSRIITDKQTKEYRERKKKVEQIIIKAHIDINKCKTIKCKYLSHTPTYTVQSNIEGLQRCSFPQGKQYCPYILEKLIVNQ